ncbi:hypothetical protein Rsub_13023 [Raphidocelis subcapitata]|uniref:F-box domain-containing protein n=1 Tax=Raphidocelis subcapitata TaxID=307507 RepID=A0A2V0PKJ1_9CHLO|nr:hypothetical protein Rsub_13023 [Raphidocelis subcapitata]|eukprot:GBG00315.1 hypothetical protein Rsub_13023 [Raphidocelis subcapitata]
MPPAAAPQRDAAAAPAPAPAAAPPAALQRDAAALVFAFLEAEELLHASRVCRAWRAIVAGAECEPAWAALCAAHGYPLLPRRDGPARLQFKEAHMAVLRERRIKRRIERMRAQSTVNNLARDVSRLREGRAAEQLANRRARADAAAAARLAQARASMQSWQLGVVRSAQEQLLRAEPINSEWRLRNLQQSIKESDAHLRTLERSIRTREQELAAARRRLGAISSA